MSTGPVRFNTKTLGGEFRLDHEGKLLGYERKEALWHAGWGPAPRPTTPSAPSWDAPVDEARLAVAVAAGTKALNAEKAAGYNRRAVRRDGKLGCGHCVPCGYHQFERCPQPVELPVAKAVAGALEATRIAKTLADAEEMERIAWAWQNWHQRVV
jgi:hypothetical protein